MFGVTLLTYILIVSIPESIYIFFFNDLGEGIKPYLLAYFFFFLALTANKPIIAILNVRGLDKLLFKWEIYSTLVKFFGVFAAYFLGSSELVIISIFASLSFLAYFILFFVVRKDFVR
jgi:O-antigen/teichoic acid export membrane protein